MIQDSTSNNSSTSAVGMFLCFSVAVNILQFFLANDDIRKLETQLLQTDQVISKLETEKSICEGKFIGFTQGRR